MVPITSNPIHSASNKTENIDITQDKAPSGESADNQLEQSVETDSFQRVNTNSTDKICDSSSMNLLTNWPERSIDGSYHKFADHNKKLGFAAGEDNFSPAALVNQGVISRFEGDYVAQGINRIDKEQAAILKQTIVDLWDDVFMYRYADGSVGEDGVVLLGKKQAGYFELGSWDNPVDEKCYQVVRWQDIDDNSYTLYFDTEQPPQLKAKQFDN